MELKECTYGDWSKLPNDVIADILIRCGLGGNEKNLIQLKCVSKSWYFIISRECVPRIMSQSTPLPLSGLLYMWARTFERKRFMEYASWVVEDKENNGYLENDDDNGFVECYLGLLPYEKQDPNHLDDCCIGLLLFVNRNSSPKQYYVCNPATRQCIPVPINTAHHERLYTALAFDPRHSPPNYTIVRFNRLPTSDPVVVQLDVFSSLTGKWVNHAVPVPFPFRHQLITGDGDAGKGIIDLAWVHRFIYLNGVLYMLCVPKYLICFDLKAKDIKAQSFELPERGVLDAAAFGDLKIPALTLGTIGVSRGCLRCSNQYQSKLLIWSFEEDRGIWNLMHSLSIDTFCFPRRKRGYWIHYPLGENLTNCFRFCRPVFMPYAFHPTSEVIFLGDRHMIFSYNPLTNQLEVASKFEDCKLLLGFQDLAYPYSRCPVVLNDFYQRQCS